MSLLFKPIFRDVFERYCTDKMLLPTFKDVRQDFLENTGLTVVTGLPYLVLCLLLAQSMQRMIDGYSGATRRTSECFLHEAIAISAMYGFVTMNEVCPDRYADLVGLVKHLQTTNTEFAVLVNDCLEFDRWNPA